MLSKNSLVIYKNFPAVIDAVTGDKYAISFCPNLQPKPGKGYPIQTQNVRDKDVTLLCDMTVSSLNAVCDAANDTALLQSISEELEQLWELFRSDKTTSDSDLTFADITGMMSVLHDSTDMWAAYKALCSDIHFEQKTQTTFRARTPQQTADIQAQLEEQHKLAAEKQQFMQRLKLNSLNLPDDARYMHEIEAIALGKSEKSHIMKELGLKETPETAHKLLLDTGIWTLTNNPYPSRYGLNLKVVDVPLPPPDADGRQTIEQTAYAIDSRWSSDPDDAISYDGQYLWVHVADPAQNVFPDSDADKQACSRGATLYLPEAIIKMLPNDSVDNYGLGLCGDDYSKALSFRISLDEDVNVTDVQIIPSLVRVKRLTYEEADALSDSPDLAPLYRLAKKIAAKRAANGAVFIDMPEIHITADVSGPKPIVTIDEDLKASEATKVVRECMVIAGEAAALFALRSKIPFPFISQPDPELKDGIPMRDGLPDGPAGSYQTRRCMKGRIVGVTPAHHAGMGLDVYCQVTSPLRRYIDLIAHQQLRLFLAGQPLMDKDTMLRKISIADVGAASTAKAERYSKLHWICVYLIGHPDEIFDGVLVDFKNRQGIVNIARLGTEFAVTVPKTTLFNDVLRLKVKDVSITELAVTWEVI